MTQLNDKAIDIKGKKYVLVSDRILAFNEDYKNGSIQTTLISDVTGDVVVIKAIITPNIEVPARVFTGYSQAKWGDGYINKTSALENAETSAVGRALAMMGIGVIDSVASADEIHKALNADKEVQPFPNDEGTIATTQEATKCPKCGAPMKVSKTGTKYCSALCWKK